MSKFNKLYEQCADMYGFADRRKLQEHEVNPEQLKIGIKIEMEHTRDPKIAKQIAMDHLAEDPHYYTKLKKANL